MYFLSKFKQFLPKYQLTLIPQLYLSQQKKKQEKIIPNYSDPHYLELERDFLNPKEFYELLLSKDINFFTGIPNNMLLDFTNYIADNNNEENHIVASHEGLALSLAAGYHLATGKIPLIYLQNSGIGNLINPVMSLVHQQVYAIPALLLIGWRGQPGKKDSEWHKAQGKNTQGLLTEMGVQFEVLPDFIEGASQVLDDALIYMSQKKAPYALLVKRQTFLKYEDKQSAEFPDDLLTRAEVIEILLKQFGAHDAVVSSSGLLSRELYNQRQLNNQSTESDFCTIGGVGHTSSIALGIALSKPSRKIICMDGDGSAIMHLGAFTQIGSSKCENFVHILFNNGQHETTGGQVSKGQIINFTQIAQASGYKFSKCVKVKEDIEKNVKEMLRMGGPTFLEIKIKPGITENLGKLTHKPLQTKLQFMEFLKK